MIEHICIYKYIFVIKIVGKIIIVSLSIQLLPFNIV